MLRVVSDVAPRFRHPRLALPALAVGAAIAVSGCSADRLSEKTAYRPDTVTVTVPAAPPSAATPPATTSPVAAPAKNPAAPRPAAAPAAAAPASAPAPAAPAATPAPAAAPSPPAPRHHLAKPRTSDTAGAHTTAATPDAEARATVLDFHRLLDERDPGACDLLTARYARATFGGDTDAAFAQCRATTQALTVRVSARITGSGAEAGGRVVDAVSHVGRVTRRQAFHLVHQDGEWLIDSAQPDGS